jgi:hypothetical protein
MKTLENLKACVLLCVVLFMAPLAEAKIARSTAAKHAFMHAKPCPSLRAHATYTCPGFVIDHIKALACGGADTPSNMQWQTLAEGKAKDKWERKGCTAKVNSPNLV